MKTQNRLTQAQRVALTLWLNKNPGVIQFTDHQVAEKASAELGFTIAASTLGGQRRAQFPDQTRNHKGGWLDKARIMEERLTAIEKFLTTPSHQRQTPFIPANQNTAPQ